METTEPIQRIVDIDSGRLMVVTDLHGNWKDYKQIIRTFKELQKSGDADTLIFLGDLVHHPDPLEDQSVKIIEDLMERKANKPKSNIKVILGNHEMVHIYHIDLWRGPDCYSQKFEHDIRPNRKKTIRFFMNMPFAFRTKGGVLLNHTGPSGIVGLKRQAEYSMDFKAIKEWDHSVVLESSRNKAKIHKEFDLYSNFHSRIGMAFTGKKKGVFLWEFLMNKNERRYHLGYDKIVATFINFMSEGRETPLTVMVNGHLQVAKGIKLVNHQQLRLCTSYGAKADKYKTYLLFNAEQGFVDTEDLATKCRALYA